MHMSNVCQFLMDKNSYGLCNNANFFRASLPLCYVLIGEEADWKQEERKEFDMQQMLPAEVIQPCGMG